MPPTRPRLKLVTRGAPQAAPGWRVERLHGPSALFGSNGIQFGPDRRLYVTQALGAQVSAIDLATGQIEHVLPGGGPIVAPDDIAFAPDGVAYITDVASATTWAWTAGADPVAHAIEQPANNGVAIGADGRLFIDEFRPGGRLLEAPAEPGQPSRVILEDLDGPNALAVARDGALFVPLVYAGEIWRVDPDSGETRRVAAGLGSPTAVKIAADGSLIVALSAEGMIVQIDPNSGAIHPLAEVPMGIDNVALDRSGRLFVSHYVDGRVADAPTDGSEPRVLNPPGFVGPFDVAVRPGGAAIVADGLSLAYLEGGVLTRRARLLTPDTMGLITTVHTTADGRTFCGGASAIWEYTPAAARGIRDDLQDVTGLSLGPDGWLWVVEREAGLVSRVQPDSGRRVEAIPDLERPTRIAIAPDGTVYITEEAAGRVVAWHDGERTTFAEGLARPQGIAVDDRWVYVLEAGAGELASFTRADGARQAIASGLPLAVPDAAQVLAALAGLSLTDDAALLVAANGDGSLLRITPH